MQCTDADSHRLNSHPRPARGWTKKENGSDALQHADPFIHSLLPQHRRLPLQARLLDTEFVFLEGDLPAWFDEDLILDNVVGFLPDWLPQSRDVPRTDWFRIVSAGYQDVRIWRTAWRCWNLLFTVTKPGVLRFSNHSSRLLQASRQCSSGEPSTGSATTPGPGIGR